MAARQHTRPPLFELLMRLPVVPLLLAVGGVTLAASLFATWFDVTAGAFSGFEGPSRQQIDEIRTQFDQSGWQFWDGGDASLFALGIGLALLALYDAVRHEVPHPALAAAGVLCAIALGILLADGFSGDSVVLLEGALGEGTGQVRIERTRAGGQWLALIGLVIALIGLGLGWRERRPDPGAAAPP
jgi:hypothetical protein